MSPITEMTEQTAELQKPPVILVMQDLLTVHQII